MTKLKRVPYTKPDGTKGERKPPGERNRKRLTEDNVLILPVRRRAQYMVWDTGDRESVKGLHVLVSPGGARTYRSLYYFVGSPSHTAASSVVLA